MSNRPKFTAAILAFFLILCFTFSWLFSHVFSENARFENFAESIFEKEVSGNALNLHYSLAYPEKQGISRPVPGICKKAEKIFPVKAQYFQSPDP